RAQCHRVGAVVGETGQGVGAGGGGDRDDVVQVVVGRVRGGGVVVGGVVAGGGDEDVTGRLGALDGVEQRLREAAAAPTVVGDRRPVGDRVVDRRDGAGGAAGAAGVEELQGHQFDAGPGNAGDADAVVAHPRDGAGDVRAVAVVVERFVVVRDEVPAVDVVDEAVAVVVDAVAGDLARVGPDVGGEVGVVVVDAGVDDRDDDAAARGDGVPRLGGVDVGVGDAAGLPGVVQAPERAVGVPRVVGGQRQ